MRGVERCQRKQPKTATKMPQTKSVSAWRESPEWMGTHRTQVCPNSLTTLPAPPTDILLRKTRAKRKNSADRVGGSSHMVYYCMTRYINTVWHVIFILYDMVHSYRITWFIPTVWYGILLYDMVHSYCIKWFFLLNYMVYHCKTWYIHTVLHGLFILYYII